MVVENYHKFARGYLASRGKMDYGAVCSDPDQRKGLVIQAVKGVSARYEAHPFFGRLIDLLSEEIRWIVQHGIATIEDYESAERIGRAGARIPRAIRKVMFEIYQEYCDLRTRSGWAYDWDNIATAVRTELEFDTSPRRYQHIVVDEGQDFSPEMIRSLSKAIPLDGSITFFGDVAQQIYGHRISWRDAGLNITKK